MVTVAAVDNSFIILIRHLRQSHYMGCDCLLVCCLVRHTYWLLCFAPQREPATQITHGWYADGAIALHFGSVEVDTKSAMMQYWLLHTMRVMPNDTTNQLADFSDCRFRCFALCLAFILVMHELATAWDLRSSGRTCGVHRHLRQQAAAFSTF